MRGGSTSGATTRRSAEGGTIRVGEGGRRARWGRRGRRGGEVATTTTTTTTTMREDGANERPSPRRRRRRRSGLTSATGPTSTTHGPRTPRSTRFEGDASSAGTPRGRRLRDLPRAFADRRARTARSDRTATSAPRTCHALAPTTGTATTRSGPPRLRRRPRRRLCPWRRRRRRGCERLKPIASEGAAPRRSPSSVGAPVRSPSVSGTERRRRTSGGGNASRRRRRRVEANRGGSRAARAARGPIARRLPPPWGRLLRPTAPSSAQTASTSAAPIAPSTRARGRSSATTTTCRTLARSRMRALRGGGMGCARIGPPSLDQPARRRRAPASSTSSSGAPGR
mmetsp:Transcript_3340/g.14593  ORF Transcript_3340/g.14593 Transcript_3340/m.14593 type:complete len:340 (-) Transcript_3340:2046-3065(-)